MGVLLRKQKEILDGRKNVFHLGSVNLFNALAVGAVTTVWSIYINGFLNNPSLTGVISGILTIISFFSYFIFIPLIERSDKGKLFFSSLFLCMVSYVLLFFARSFFLFFLVATMLTVLYTIRIVTFGVMVKDSSKRKDLAKNEGAIYTFLNLGWLFAPLIAAYIMGSFGERHVFLVAALFTLFAIIVAHLTNLRDSRKSNESHNNFFKNFRGFFSDVERRKAYILGGGASMWWVLIYLFLPLYILKEGFGDFVIGYIFFLIVLPLVFCEYPFSKITSKRGYRFSFLLGFLIVGILTTTCYFLTDNYQIFALLVLASFGMALLEPTAEAYFLSVVSKGDAGRYFGPYSTTKDISQFLAKIFPSLIILFLPFKTVFLFFGIIALLMFFYSSSALGGRE